MVDAISTASTGTPAAYANTSTTAGSVPAPSATTATQSQASAFVIKPLSIAYLPLPGDAAYSSQSADGDLSKSFIDLITASSAKEANSRVIATAQDLFQSLLQLPR
jgi:hypothetical protein